MTERECVFLQLSYYDYTHFNDSPQFISTQTDEMNNKKSLRKKIKSDFHMFNLQPKLIGNRKRLNGIHT